MGTFDENQWMPCRIVFGKLALRGRDTCHSQLWRCAECRFKEAVHILVEHARETMPEFPKEEKKPCLKKRKSSKRGTAFRKV